MFLSSTSIYILRNTDEKICSLVIKTGSTNFLFVRYPQIHLYYYDESLSEYQYFNLLNLKRFKAGIFSE